MNFDSIHIKIFDKFTNERVLMEEFTTIGAPQLIYNGADDKFQPIMTSEFSFDMVSKDNADGSYFHLFTGNERRYYILVENQDEEMIFEGWLLPDFYTEPYHNSVMPVTFKATDALAALKSQTLDEWSSLNEVQIYLKEIGVVDLIAKILKKTGLSKEIYIAPGIIPFTLNGLKWHDIAVNLESYIDGYKIIGFPNFNQNPYRYKSEKNCYDILELLMKSMGCTLFPQGNKWMINGINRKNEVSCDYFVYDQYGYYLRNEIVDKDVIDVNNYFSYNPTVSINSPFKEVNVNWEIKEDENLVPDYAFKVVDAQSFQEIEKGWLDYWKENGGVDVYVVNKTLTIDGADEFLFTYDAPNVIGLGFDVNFYVNKFLSLKKPKYINHQKYSGGFRKLDVDLEVLIHSAFASQFSPYGDLTNRSNEEILSRLFIDVFIGSAKILANPKSNNVAWFNFEANKSVYTGQSIQGVLQWFKLHQANFKSQEISMFLTNSGFFDFKLFELHAWTTYDYRGYAIPSCSMKIEVYDSLNLKLKRNIDFTTTYDLDVFHCDSKSDLTNKQWLFRKKIFSNQPLTAILISSITDETIVGLTKQFKINLPLDSVFFDLLRSNKDMIMVYFNNEYRRLIDIVSIDNILFFNSFGTENFLMLIGNNENTVNTEGLYYDNIGQNLSDFQSLHFDYTKLVTGYEFEDNEERENWLVYGKNQVKRFQRCIGEVYHSVYPSATSKIEGQVLKCFLPNDILNFNWLGNKNYIPTRLTIDFSNGKTNCFLVEALNNDVNDINAFYYD